MSHCGSKTRGFCLQIQSNASALIFLISTYANKKGIVHVAIYQIVFAQINDMLELGTDVNY